MVGVISVNVTLKLLYCRFGDDYYYYYCSDHDDVDGEKGGGLKVKSAWAEFQSIYNLNCSYLIKSLIGDLLLSTC